MDQRSDQLKDEGWIEDRSATLPARDEASMLVAEGVEYRDTDDDVDTETERIKAEIEDTRAEMGQTLNELQERLSPEHLMDQVKETVREATIGKVERAMEKVNETISNVTEPAMEVMGRAGEKIKEGGSAVTNSIYRNPIPFALVGLGLGMIIIRQVRGADTRTTRSQRTYELDSDVGYGMATPRYAGRGAQYGTSGEYAGAARQYASKRGTLKQMTHTASDLMHGTAETVSNLTHQAKERAVKAGRGLEHLVYQNPLAVGAAAVAVGAAVGLALPRTRIEKEYMGEASEKLVDRAQQVARDAMDKVKTAAQPAQQHSQRGQQSQPGQQSRSGQQSQPGQQPGQQAQPRTRQSQAGQSQTGHGHTGQGQPGKGTPTA
jgi:hypothetical protein